ncbi:hypothetical protein A9C19_07880 [Bacillus weihaiensis]|uniref:Uncharacterized protein n=2 Tax=Bacillus weihaiensis TaxID=1547283 RepID=A0A1L3MQQ5_9BACI|nr:hypothetical protein A9C19_07880 [Bacillus weihaiensis]
MIKLMHSSVRAYMNFLEEKGFQLGEDALGFIHFGQHYTEANDEKVIVAIELTLKIQKEFDGAFFISLLEMFSHELIESRKQAYKHVKLLGLLS